AHGVRMRTGRQRAVDLEQHELLVDGVEQEWAGQAVHGAASLNKSSGFVANQCLIRRSAISTYSASRSMPTNPQPSMTAAMPVVPLPANGSSTRPPAGVTSRTSHRISSIGFTVGWWFRGPS